MLLPPVPSPEEQGLERTLQLGVHIWHVGEREERLNHLLMGRYFTGVPAVFLLSTAEELACLSQ